MFILFELSEDFFSKVPTNQPSTARHCYRPLEIPKIQQASQCNFLGHRFAISVPGHTHLPRGTYLFLCRGAPKPSTPMPRKYKTKPGICMLHFFSLLLAIFGACQSCHTWHGIFCQNVGNLLLKSCS